MARPNGASCSQERQMETPADAADFLTFKADLSDPQTVSFDDGMPLRSAEIGL